MHLALSKNTSISNWSDVKDNTSRAATTQHFSKWKSCLFSSQGNIFLAMKDKPVNADLPWTPELSNEIYFCSVVFSFLCVKSHSQTTLFKCISIVLSPILYTMVSKQLYIYRQENSDSMMMKDPQEPQVHQSVKSLSWKRKMLWNCS